MAQLSQDAQQTKLRDILSPTKIDKERFILCPTSPKNKHAYVAALVDIVVKNLTALFKLQGMKEIHNRRATFMVNTVYGSVQFTRTDVAFGFKTIMKVLRKFGLRGGPCKFNPRPPVTLQDLRGVYTPVYVGPALINFFASAVTPSNVPVFNQAQYPFLFQNRVAVYSTLRQMLYAWIYSVNASDTTDGRFFAPDAVFDGVFNSRNPADNALWNMGLSTDGKIIKSIPTDGGSNTIAQMAAAYPEAFASGRLDRLNTWMIMSIVAANIYTSRQLENEAAKVSLTPVFTGRPGLTGETFGRELAGDDELRQGIINEYLQAKNANALAKQAHAQDPAVRQAKEDRKKRHAEQAKAKLIAARATRDQKRKELEILGKDLQDNFKNMVPSVRPDGDVKYVLSSTFPTLEQEIERRAKQHNRSVDTTVKIPVRA